jgi:hypothetical protein
MTAEARRVLDAATSENAFQASVLELAASTGWLAHHVRPARRKDGDWRTPLQGNAGYPDLTLAHPDGLVVIAELKAMRGKLAREQARWLDAMNGAELHSYLWRPNDWDYIEQLLVARCP